MLRRLAPRVLPSFETPAFGRLLRMTVVFAARKARRMTNLSGKLEREELPSLDALPRRLHPGRDVLRVPAGDPGEVLRLLAEARRQ
jgi:hypothetical protein